MEERKKEEKTHFPQLVGNAMVNINVVALGEKLGDVIFELRGTFETECGLHEKSLCGPRQSTVFLGTERVRQLGGPVHQL